MGPEQRALLELAKRYFKAEQHKEAFATLRYAVEKYGPAPDVDRLLGAAAQKCEDEDIAVAAYERALPHFPKDAYLRVSLAELYVQRVRPVEAGKLLEEAMALDPDIKSPAGLRARIMVMRAKKQFS